MPKNPQSGGVCKQGLFLSSVIEFFLFFDSEYNFLLLAIPGFMS